MENTMNESLLNWAFHKGIEANNAFQKGSEKSDALREYLDKKIKNVIDEQEAMKSRFKSWTSEVNEMIDKYIEKKINERLEVLLKVASYIPPDERVEKIASLNEMNVKELHISARALRCLQAEDINTVGVLITKTEWDLRKITNFGRTSLMEVKEALWKLGLTLNGPAERA
jgi:DNA-directed RNA polymerase alpha subunit